MHSSGLRATRVPCPFRAEAVEPRRMMSVALNPATGVLRVNGGEGNDHVAFALQKGDPSRLRVDVNGVVKKFAAGAVKQIVVSAGAGHDGIDLGGLRFDTRIDAGAGLDLVRGGAGRDVVYGGDGNDFVFGGDGHDRLFGGAGDDYLSGDAGHDHVRGEHGDDSPGGGDGKDRVYGGAGADEFGSMGAARERVDLDARVDRVQAAAAISSPSESAARGGRLRLTSNPVVPPGARFDLTNNAIVVDYGATSGPFADIRSIIGGVYTSAGPGIFGDEPFFPPAILRLSHLEWQH